jgi:hypothetical protein
MDVGHHASIDRDQGIDALVTKLKELSLDTMHVKNSTKIGDIISSMDYPQRSARHEAIPEAYAETFRWALTRPEIQTLETSEAKSIRDTHQSEERYSTGLKLGREFFGSRASQVRENPLS